jgi:plastocyanin
MPRSIRSASSALSVALAGLAIVLAGCAAAPTEPVATNQVELPPSYRFEPAAITVPDGTTVTWTNHDSFTHNVRLLDDGGEVLALPPGESVSFTFSGPGEHRYDCSLHPNDMSGVVIVSES